MMMNTKRSSSAASQSARRHPVDDFDYVVLPIEDFNLKKISKSRTMSDSSSTSDSSSSSSSSSSGSDVEPEVLQVRSASTHPPEEMSSLSQAPRKCQVVVIGAGLSGMSAAKWLHEAGIDVVVLEARDRLGGRTYTKKVPTVDYVEMGGAYLGPGQKYLLRMARDLGVEKYAIDEGTGSTIFYDETSGRRRFFPPDGEPAIWNPLVLLDINNFFRNLDKCGEEIPMHAPWEAPHANEWDQMTVKEYADKEIWTEPMRDMLRTFHNVRMASHPYEASFLWFVWHVRQYGSVKRLLSTFGAEKWKFSGGAMQICERIADRLDADAVQLKKAVVGVRQDADGCTVTTLDGAVYESGYVIFAAPPVVGQKIHFQPPMPAIRNQMVQRVPMGSVTKVVVFYEQAFWYERGLSGASVIDGGEQDDDHPLNFTMDGTKPDGSHPCLIGFIWTDKARRLFERTDRDERKQLIARSLAKAFDDQRFLQPILYEELNWAAEQYSGGCYSMVLSPGTFTTFRSTLRNPVGRLFFAGTETALTWSGHMDGAISAGERAAREALHAMGKISDDQIWLEEPASKEDPPEDDVQFSLLERHLPSVKGLINIGKACFVLFGLLVYFVYDIDILP